MSNPAPATDWNSSRKVQQHASIHLSRRQVIFGSHPASNYLLAFVRRLTDSDVNGPKQVPLLEDPQVFNIQVFSEISPKQ
jgi:hypothetical protein